MDLPSRPNGSIRLDLGAVPGREWIRSDRLPTNAARPNDAPSDDDHPKGWTVQHIVRQPEVPMLLCIFCWAEGDHTCRVLEAVSQHG